MNASARTTTLALAAVAALTLPEGQAEPEEQAQDVGGAAEASVEETTTVDYPSGLSVTLTKLEDISEEYNDYYADFGSELTGLYGESGLVWGPAAPTRLGPGSSFEYAETCMLTPCSDTAETAPDAPASAGVGVLLGQADLRACRWRLGRVVPAAPAT